MIKLNKETYLDKLHACWLGKSIGGTMGAPYEGSRDFLDIKGFSSPSGEPLPNDDLDLQLVWLNAVESEGIRNINANILGEYWLDWISPHWNEYGIAKTNLRLGLLPPVSGEFDNDKWKTSNGAWIRSEIWAGLAPCAVDVAVKYASMDAMVDHGLGEGTYAEIFTSAMQSAAYYESDIKTLLKIALAKIPESTMIHKTVSLVMDCYEKGIDYKETREKIVEFNKELGWFQAPNNLGFVAIGLLYGEKDFKKSLIYTINCADDTDCTAGTVGATLGIIGGVSAIPDELKSYVGDRIITVTINGMYNEFIPDTCTTLTNRIVALVPSVMKANDVKLELCEGKSELTQNELDAINVLGSDDFLDRSPYSYDYTYGRSLNVRVEMDKTPRVKPLEKRQIKLTFYCGHKCLITRKLELKFIMPDGFVAEGYERIITLPYPQPLHNIYGIESTSFTVTIGEKIEAVNRCYVEVTSNNNSTPLMIPLVFIG